MTQVMEYPVKLTPDDNDTLLVSSPDFPEHNTFGENRADALQRAVDALETAIQGRIGDREDVPLPGRGKVTVRLTTLSALKVLLYRAMREQDVTKAEMSRRLECHKPQVDRLLDLRHGTRLDHLDAAFSALGLVPKVDLVAA